MTVLEFIEDYSTVGDFYRSMSYLHHVFHLPVLDPLPSQIVCKHYGISFTRLKELVDSYMIGDAAIQSFNKTGIMSTKKKSATNGKKKSSGGGKKPRTAKSANDGKFVSNEFAEKHPAETYRPGRK